MYDILSYIGGFWKSIFAMGFLLSRIFSYQLFVKSIMKRLYHFEEESELSATNNKVVPDEESDRGHSIVNRFLKVLWQKSE